MGLAVSTVLFVLFEEWTKQFFRSKFGRNSVEIRSITNRWINLVAFFRIQSNLLKTLINCTLLKLKNIFLNLEIIPGETIPVRKILGKKKILYC